VETYLELYGLELCTAPLWQVGWKVSSFRKGKEENVKADDQACPIRVVPNFGFNASLKLGSAF
jgi:hypothetical protein